LGSGDVEKANTSSRAPVPATLRGARLHPLGVNSIVSGGLLLKASRRPGRRLPRGTGQRGRGARVAQPFSGACPDAMGAASPNPLVRRLGQSKPSIPALRISRFDHGNTPRSNPLSNRLVACRLIYLNSHARIPKRRDPALPRQIPRRANRDTARTGEADEAARAASLRVRPAGTIV